MKPVIHSIYFAALAAQDLESAELCFFLLRAFFTRQFEIAVNKILNRTRDLRVASVERRNYSGNIPPKIEHNFVR